MSVSVILGRKCALAVSRTDSWLVRLNMHRLLH